jgi:hypothetical protein
MQSLVKGSGAHSCVIRRSLRIDFLLLLLQDFEHSDDVTFQHEPRRGRSIVEDRSVKRIPILPLVDGMKPQS